MDFTFSQLLEANIPTAVCLAQETIVAESRNDVQMRSLVLSGVDSRWRWRTNERGKETWKEMELGSDFWIFRCRHSVEVSMSSLCVLNPALNL